MRKIRDARRVLPPTNNSQEVDDEDKDEDDDEDERFPSLSSENKTGEHSSTEEDSEDSDGAD